ncbi:hypothetical protein ACFL1R_01655 [Candidatus Latescibacterota bacterium]
MLKPPFTVLILKDSQHPVTVRVTTGFVLSVFVLICFIGAMIGSGATYYYFQKYAGIKEVVMKSTEPAYIPQKADSAASTQSADIQRLTVKHHKNGDTDVIMTFTGIEENREVYVWLLVNPEAETVGEMVIYPRNPVFRGLPVDYRNGITYYPYEGQEITITLSDEVEGILIKQFRIIVYSSEGKILIDKYFSEN